MATEGESDTCSDKHLEQTDVLDFYCPTSLTTSKESDLMKAKVSAHLSISCDCGSLPGTTFSVILAQQVQ